MPKFISPQIERKIRKNRSKFRSGNKSVHFLSDRNFFKLWAGKAPGHEFMTSSNYQATSKAGMVAQLEDYGSLRNPCTIQGYKYGYVYVFSKLNARPFDIDEVLNALNQERYWWIDNLWF
jgi:hypothetical protein